jgi:hypothetical protein
MKPKVHHQLQPRKTVPARSEQFHVHQDEVQAEIRDFLRAVASYPDRAAKEPSVSFHEHLCSIFAAGDPRSGTRPKRH